MQLRDETPNISFPAMWGFFGGTIENNESPIQAPKRELDEEIGFRHNTFVKRSIYTVKPLNNTIVY